jgi:hypothetical protein
MNEAIKLATEKGGYKEVTFAFNNNTTHSEVLENIIKKLVKAGFCKRKEIIQEWKTLLSAKIIK